jgi:chemotaxis protein methyltransferase CheR
VSAIPVVKLTFEELCSRVSELISKKTGNVFKPEHLTMVRTRLQRRLLESNMMDPEVYWNYLQNNYEAELDQLVSLLTTHHTFFFREFNHFEYLLKNLTKIIANVKSRGEKVVRVYSAACSKGQEVYSLAMFFETHLKQIDPTFSYKILGTDIDSQSVAVASKGIYNYNEIKEVPQLYLQGNWQKGTGEIADLVKVKSHLREKCDFRVGNLMHLPQELGSEKFDIIFCRNVFIYFDNKDISKISLDFKNHLHPGGFLVTGISESLKHLNLPLQTLAPSVYSFETKLKVVDDQFQSDLPTFHVGNLNDSRPLEHKPNSLKIVPANSPDLSAAQPIRVLVVDDSPAVVKLLTQVFQKDSAFELVGTATNGLEAAEFLKTHQVDAMTLDIHMPECDGVTYLRKYFGEKHPRVIMVSSVNREDTQYAQEALRLGADDFVEKPALNNLAEKGEEIKLKMKIALMSPARSSEALPKSDLVAKAFTIQNVDHKMRIFVLGPQHLSQVDFLLSELRGNQPATLLVFNSDLPVNEKAFEKFKSLSSDLIKDFKKSKNIFSNHLYWINFSDFNSDQRERLSSRYHLISLMGHDYKNIVRDCILSFEKRDLFLEELPSHSHELTSKASDQFPWTSFGPIGTQYLAK